MQENFHKKVRSKNVIWTAWQAIRENGRTSRSTQTQDEVRRFDQSALKEINKIAGHLSADTFKFAPGVGIPQAKKDGKTYRPIVRAPIANRVVQRAILDVIQGDENIRSAYDSENSFGGLIGKGVGAAVGAAQSAVLVGGASYYIASDIKGFFNDIRREHVVAGLGGFIQDAKFITLFSEALNTELSNIEELRQKEKHDLFPIYELGVAQGCCLSPLAGNIFLRDFDQKLNTRDVFCLRYIDDFIILGPNRRVVEAKFREAINILESKGLSAYKPGDGSGKAFSGETSKAFDYLGCTIQGKTIRPSKKSWQRLKAEIDQSFDEALRTAGDVPAAIKRRATFTETVGTNSRKLEGWIKQYSEVCNDQRIIGQWNQELQKSFIDFENRYFRLLKDHSLQDRAAVIGLYDIQSAFQSRRMAAEKRRGEVRGN